MLKLSQRAQVLRASITHEISSRMKELKREGIEIINLSATELDFPTPQPIQKAMIEALGMGITRLAPSQGFFSLRAAIAKLMHRENGVEIQPEEIIVTSGSKHALFLALQCLLDPGDTVLLPTPAWPGYSPLVELSGAHIIPLSLFEEDSFRINVERWKGLSIPANARGIIINSPNNPTGVVYSKDELISLSGWALQRDLWILSDEVYANIVYADMFHTALSSLGPEVKNHLVTCRSFSDVSSMSGWRIGWAVANKYLIEKMASIQFHTNHHVTGFVQWAAISASAHFEHYARETVAALDTRRKFCAGELSQLSEHLSYFHPEGAYYFFINLSPWLSKAKMSDREFCFSFLNDQHVAMLPGEAFGKKSYARLSYSVPLPVLKQAFERLRNFLEPKNRKLTLKTNYPTP